MAKKKKIQKDKSFIEALGFDKLFHNERLNFILGIVLILLAVYMSLAFISFFSAGYADQSLVESPK